MGLQGGRCSFVGRGARPYLAKERVRRRPITPSHHDPRLTNPIAAENLDPSGVVPNCCLKNGRGFTLSMSYSADRRLDASTRLAESAHINRKCSASFGFHIQSWGFNATLNLRVESRRRRNYGTPRVAGREGLTRARTCRPQSKKPFRKKIFSPYWTHLVRRHWCIDGTSEWMFTKPCRRDPLSPENSTLTHDSLKAAAKAGLPVTDWARG